MRIRCISVGMLDVNCYLVWDETAREALVVDPGDDADKVGRELRTQGLTPTGILLTHGHVDHIRGVPDVARAFGIPVWLHAAERELYASPQNAILPWLPAAAGLPEPATALPQAAGLLYRVLETPGHTPGGVSYYFAAAATVFTGDTLFAGGIGRTDFPGGDTEALLRSIRGQLLNLPPATVVYPGHGPATSIGDEAGANPFLTE